MSASQNTCKQTKGCDCTIGFAARVYGGFSDTEPRTVIDCGVYAKVNLQAGPSVTCMHKLCLAVQVSYHTQAFHARDNQGNAISVTFSLTIPDT